MQAKLYSQLSQLLWLMSKSFPQYVRYSRPYIPSGREMEFETLVGIAADQDILAERVSQLLMDAGAPLRSGEFPMEYTDTHDLGIDYQVRSAIEYQEQDIATLEQIIKELEPFPMARPLAEEALGMAKGHLEALHELVEQPVGA